MTNVFKIIVSAIRSSFSSPNGSPKVTVSGVRQVSAQYAPNLPRARNATIRHQIGPVPRNPLPYWQERGWQRKRDVYEGIYQVDEKIYEGVAERRESGFDFFIVDPPKYRCFFPRGDGRFFVHVDGPRPQTVSSGLMSVEAAIREALK